VQSEIILSYKLKLYPTRNKADCLAGLTALFQRAHSDCTLVMGQPEESRPLLCPSSKGLGEFTGRAYRRAYIDYRRTLKASRKTGRPFHLPRLRAELIDSADLQLPKQAKHFDYWVLIKGTKDKLYIPAKGHRGLNRTLALPGAQLNLGTKGSAEVFRKNGTWYVRVNVKVPTPEVAHVTGTIGIDIGVRCCVARSDGYRGPDLRPILKKQRDRRAMQQKHGLDKRSNGTFQKQLLCREARRVVSVAQRTGRAIAVEDPKRLIRWKGHAARFFGNRVALLAAIVGVPCVVVNPAYSSTTCPKCGKVERHMRHKETLRCWECGYTQNADFVASQNICHWGHGVTAISQGLLSRSPGGGAVE
jgi:hypothetical protein